MKKVQYLLVLLFCIIIGLSFGQGKQKLIQFSGLIVEGDSLLGFLVPMFFFQKQEEEQVPIY